MAYFVWTGLNQQGAGTFEAKTESKQEAMERALNLRKQGLEVRVTGPDGNRRRLKMPQGPQGERRPADVIGNAVHVMRIATGQIADDVPTPADERPRRRSR
jgi:hypothetical protein